MTLMPECGDRVYTYVPGLFNRVQRFFVTHLGESRTRATHVGGVVRCGEVINAHWPAVRKDILREYLDQVESKGGSWCIVRDREPLTHAEETQWDFCMCRHEGAVYSLPEIVGQALDGLVNKVSVPVFEREVTFFRRAADRLPDWVICSGLVAKVRVRIGRIPRSLRTASPDDLWDDEVRRMSIVVSASAGWRRRGLTPGPGSDTVSSGGDE